MSVKQGRRKNWAGSAQEIIDYREDQVNKLAGQTQCFLVCHATQISDGL
jgi:hypothetical protein